jgi:hypothetical protein
VGNGTQQNRLQEQQARTLGHIKLRLDPWEADFGPEFTGFDEASPEVSEKVDIEIETPLTKWGVLDPSPGPVPEPVWFIDGVRRIEARVTVEIEGHYTYGGFGAYAVAAVRLASADAVFERILTGRVLALCSAKQPDTSVSVAPGLTYIPVRVKESEPDAPLRAIHGEMRKAEETLGRELASEPGRLVIVDGPLTFEEASRGAAVGYIKRVMKIYLPPAQLPTLIALSPGQRTPLFALRGSTRFSRLSWFLRLTEARRGDSEFSGIVRMEVAESVGTSKRLGSLRMPAA